MPYCSGLAMKNFILAKHQDMIELELGGLLYRIEYQMLA